MTQIKNKETAVELQEHSLGCLSAAMVDNHCNGDKTKMTESQPS